MSDVTAPESPPRACASPGEPTARPPTEAASPSHDAPPRRRRFQWRLAAVGAVLAGALCFLLVKGLAGSLDYFETVDQAIAQKATLGTKTVRLEGVVVPGTVHRTPGGVDFVASGTHDRIAVENTGNPPQLFQPDIPVVVVGHFEGAKFVSNQIIVDHTSQYIEEHPARG